MDMKLMTKAIEKKFEKFPMYSQDGKGMEAEVVVKYFGGAAATWLITEGEKQPDGDWLFFGYCTLGFEWEWGEVMLSQLESVRFAPFGLGVERDLHCEGMKVKELVN